MAAKILKMQSDYIYPNGEKYGKLLVNFIGEGKDKVSVEKTEIKPGFSIAVMTVQENSIKGFQFESKNSPLEFSYCIQGSGFMEFKEPKSKKNQMLSIPGMNIISQTKSVKGSIEVLEKNFYKAAALHIDPNFIKDFFELSKIKPELFKIFEKNQKNFFISQPMNYKMKKIISEILNCDLEGKFKELFIESKAIELFLTQMESFSGSNLIVSPEISKNDIEKIYEAKNILLRNIENPPGITMLAKLSGINEFKLKKGFKEIFGTSIYKYLKSWRMAYAKDLILDGKTNVNDLAFSAGYSNVSHFISGFKKEFGETPGQLIKKIYF
jgi:AraC-like DNA-binding protein